GSSWAIARTQVSVRPGEPSTPSRSATGLAPIHTSPPEYAAAPPSRSAASNAITSLPPPAAPHAVASPDSPAPTTITGSRASTMDVSFPLRTGGGPLRTASGALDELGLQVGAEALHVALASQAGLLVAAEGLHHTHVPAVDRHLSGPDAPGDPLGLGGVPGVHRARQPVVRVVGQRHGLLDVVERDDADDRTEDLLLGDAHVVAHVGEHGRLDEPSALETR